MVHIKNKSKKNPLKKIKNSTGIPLPTILCPWTHLGFHCFLSRLPPEILFPSLFSIYPLKPKIEKQNMCEWRSPPQRTMAASATCCRDAMGLSSPLISERAIQQIRVGLKTPCPRTGHWRKTCANLTLSSLLKGSQLWTKAAEASWLCWGLPLYPPLWCWPTYFHSMSKSAHIWFQQPHVPFCIFVMLSASPISIGDFYSPLGLLV